MKTELIFFDSFNESIKGTKRGLIAFIALILLDLIQNYFLFKIGYKQYITKNINILGRVFSWLMLCSAIGVQKPKLMKEAIVYGALVGSVAYGVYNGINYAINNKWPLKIYILDFIWGIIMCSIAALMVYLFYWKHYS